MSATTITIARVLELRIPIAWQEAVEVAHAAGKASEAGGVPMTLHSCRLSVSGTLELGRGGRERTGKPLSTLQLLRALLEGQAAPPELRELVASADDSLPSGSSSAGDESRAPKLNLDWFVRSNPEMEIARLAARALAAEEALADDAEIERLRAEVIDMPRSPTPATGRSPGRTLVLAVVVVAAVGVAAWAMWSSPLPPVGEWLTVSPPAATDAGATVPDASPRAPAPDGAAPDGARLPIGGAREASGRARQSGAAADPITGGPPQAGADPGPSNPDARLSSPIDSRSPATTADAGAERGGWTLPGIEGVLYSDWDVDVQPPALVHPQLPSAPKADRWPRSSFIELIVDEEGRVLKVRLDSSDLSLNDRMLVAATKAWQFRPAVKDGRPVKYMLRMPLTQ